MSDQATLNRQICNVIRSLYPEFKGRADQLGTGQNGRAKLTVLGRMEPCEKCGTPIVPLERESGHRNWWHLREARREGNGWRVLWDQHSTSRCEHAREATP